jgi:curved DNA-binding protein CbpA
MAHAYHRYYRLLGLTAGATGEEIRQRYIELVRQYPPDREPERFKEIHGAYGKLKDLPSRLESFLFDTDMTPDQGLFVADLKGRARRRPIPLLEILRSCRKS